MVTCANILTSTRSRVAHAFSFTAEWNTLLPLESFIDSPIVLVSSRNEYDGQIGGCCEIFTHSLRLKRATLLCIELYSQLVGAVGFEPTTSARNSGLGKPKACIPQTPRLDGQHATKLRYAPTLEISWRMGQELNLHELALDGFQDRCLTIRHTHPANKSNVQIFSINEAFKSSVSVPCLSPDHLRRRISQ